VQDPEAQKTTKSAAAVLAATSENPFTGSGSTGGARP
jgi:hypothetical protein